MEEIFPISTFVPPYSGEAEALHAMIFKYGEEKTPPPAAGSSVATCWLRIEEIFPI
jgi:hypothetical protein